MSPEDRIVADFGRQCHRAANSVIATSGDIGIATCRATASSQMHAEKSTPRDAERSEATDAPARHEP